MRFWVYLVVLLLAFCELTAVSAQDGSAKNRKNTEPESLLRALRAPDSLKILDKATIASELWEFYQSSSPDQLHLLSSATLRSGDSALFRTYNRKVLDLPPNQTTAYAKGVAHWDLADFLKRSLPDSAFYHYQKAYGIFTEIPLNDTATHYPGVVLLDIANLKNGIKDYFGAERDQVEAINYFEETQRTDRLFNAYNSLAITQKDLNRFDKSLAYHQKAKSFISKSQKSKQALHGLINANNMASVYLSRKDYQTAFIQFDSLAQQKNVSLINVSIFAKIVASRGYAGYLSGAMSKEEALVDLRTSNLILDSIENNYAKARNYEYLARIWAKEGDTVNSIAAASRAKSIAKTTQNNERLLSSLQFLTLMDKEHSTVHAEDYFRLAEEIAQKENDIQEKFALIRMETDDVIANNAKLKKRNELYAGLVLAIIVAGLGVVTIVVQRIKNQKLLFKQKQQESNQEIYKLLLSQKEKLEEGKKSEQKRMSEELHDGILGQMLGIRLIMSGLNDRTDEDSIQQRAGLIDKLQEVEEEIRTISHELNEASYGKVDNFMRSIQELIDNTKSASKDISIAFDHSEDFNWDGLPSETKINSYRIIQEGLSNCIKHSHCKNISVGFHSEKKNLTLTITDDGIGFNSKANRTGIGFKNIQSRTKKLSGRLHITSLPSKGTQIKVTFKKPSETSIFYPQTSKQPA